MMKIDCAFNPAEIAVAESLLRGEGVRYFIQNELMSPLVGGGGGKTFIFVGEADLMRANELLQPLMEGRE